jgi:hypothetical protein
MRDTYSLSRAVFGSIAEMKELEELEYWPRAEFFEKGGWEKMPGQEKAGSAVARACADGLELLIKK